MSGWNVDEDMDREKPQLYSPAGSMDLSLRGVSRLTNLTEFSEEKVKDKDEASISTAVIDEIPEIDNEEHLSKCRIIGDGVAVDVNKDVDGGLHYEPNVGTSMDNNDIGEASCSKYDEDSLTKDGDQLEVGMEAHSGKDMKETETASDADNGAVDSLKNLMSPDALGQVLGLISVHESILAAKESNGTSTANATDCIEPLQSLDPVPDPEKSVNFSDMVEAAAEEEEEEVEEEPEPEPEPEPEVVRPLRKRGRPRKVVIDDAPWVESDDSGAGKKQVRKRRKKTVDRVKKKHRCTKCKGIFSSKSQLESHVVICGALKPARRELTPTKGKPAALKGGLACPVCHKSYTKWSRMGIKWHFAYTHINLVHISCVLCSKKLGGIDDSYEHFKKEHSESFTKLKQTEEVQNSILHQCPACDYCVQGDTHIKHHWISSHSHFLHVSCTLCQRTLDSLLRCVDHFSTYHLHSSVTGKRNNEVVTTNTTRIMKAIKKERKAASVAGGTSEITSPPDKADATCKDCNKYFGNYKLLASHMLSHTVNENTDIVSQKACVQTLSTSVQIPSTINEQTSSTNIQTPSESVQPPSSVDITSDFIDKPDCFTDTPESKPLDEHASDAQSDLKISAVLGPDLLAAVNRSFVVMNQLAGKLNSELKWDLTDEACTRRTLARKLNELLLFTTGISDIGKCLLLVLEECLQYEENLCQDTYNHGDEFIKDELSDSNSRDDADLVVTFQNDTDEAKELGPYDVFTKNPFPYPEMYQATTSTAAATTTTTTNTTGVAKKKVVKPKATSKVKTPKVKEDSNGLKRETNDTDAPKKPKSTRKTVMCPICGKQTQKLKCHMRTHSEFKPFKCEICPASFKEQRGLDRHSLIHLKDNRYKCDFCNFTQRTMRRIKMHILEKHPNSATFFRCDLCNFKAKTTYHLAEHRKIHKPQKCKTCGFEGKNRNELRVHMRENHQSKFFCSECTYSTVYKMDLKRHMKTHAIPDASQDYCCDMCGATFNSLSRFKYHVIRHENKTPLSCKQCDYKCSSRQSLTTHMLKHTGRKPYQCSACPAAFYRMSHLKQHMKTHTEEKNHCCKYCGKGFASRFNCLEHENTHTGEKRYKCKICTFSCRRLKYLTQHMTQHKPRDSDMEISEDEGARASAQASAPAPAPAPAPIPVPVAPSIVASVAAQVVAHGSNSNDFHQRKPMTAHMDPGAEFLQRKPLAAHVDPSADLFQRKPPLGPPHPDPSGDFFLQRRQLAAHADTGGDFLLQRNQLAPHPDVTGDFLQPLAAHQDASSHFFLQRKQFGNWYGT